MVIEGALDMTFFYRYYFHNSPGNDPSSTDSQPFHTFYNLVNKGGGALYRVMFIITTVAILVGLGASLVNFVLASSGRPRDEAKAKVQRTMIIAFGIACVTGVVDLIFKIFTWI